MTHQGAFCVPKVFALAERKVKSKGRGILIRCPISTELNVTTERLKVKAELEQVQRKTKVKIQGEILHSAPFKMTHQGAFCIPKVFALAERKVKSKGRGILIRCPISTLLNVTTGRLIVKAVLAQVQRKTKVKIQGEILHPTSFHSE